MMLKSEVDTTATGCATYGWKLTEQDEEREPYAGTHYVFFFLKNIFLF